MKEDTLICNFSGVYGAQGFMPQEAVEVDLSGIQGTCCYCSAEEEIEAMLPEVLPKQRWIDSGDYHYMSYILAKRQKEPFHLLLLDNHPDNQEPAFPGILSCGSWVKVMREENKLLLDILWVGPEGSADYKQWLESRRGERLYISLDKDVMSKDWARTDWTQGDYSLEQIESILREAFEKMDVVAIDICGEMAPGKGATGQDNRINFETNTKLNKLITGYVGN